MTSTNTDLKELAKHAWIFNSIAPIYNLFFQAQVKNYRSLLATYQKELQLVPGAAWEVLDIGCGTGAYLTAFAELGYQGTGVDFSAPMLKAARRSTRNLTRKSTGNSIRHSTGKLTEHSGELNLKFIQADATKGLPFSDKSFDLVVAAYVLHGLRQSLRQQIYAEAKRLARRTVLFFDYNHKRSLPTDVIEWAEGGDYFNFIKLAEAEMQQHFPLVKRLDVGPHSSIYICSPSN